MPMIEVDENAFHNNAKLVGLVQQMLKNPTARRKVLEAHKTIDPNVVIPELDAAKPVEDAVSAVTKRMEDFMAKVEVDREKEKSDAQRNAFVSKFEGGRNSLRDQGVTDEGLKAVEDLMAKAGIVDHEIGWAAFSKLNPEPEPAPPAPNFGLGGVFTDAAGKSPDEFIKSMHASRGTDSVALDKRIHEVLQDVRKQNAPTPQRRQGFGR